MSSFFLDHEAVSAMVKGCAARLFGDTWLALARCGAAAWIARVLSGSDLAGGAVSRLDEVSARSPRDHGQSARVFL